MFPRLTTLATTAAAAAVALTGMALPANAEAVVYDSYGVQSNLPDGGHEYATLDIPTGYEVDRLNWHTTVFHETVDQGRAIHVDLNPESDTVEELRQALLGFREIYNTIWLIERHGFQTPAAVRQNQLSPAVMAA